MIEIYVSLTLTLAGSFCRSESKHGGISFYLFKKSHCYCLNENLLRDRALVWIIYSYVHKDGAMLGVTKLCVSDHDDLWMTLALQSKETVFPVYNQFKMVRSINKYNILLLKHRLGTVHWNDLCHGVSSIDNLSQIFVDKLKVL